MILYIQTFRINKIKLIRYLQINSKDFLTLKLTCISQIIELIKDNKESSFLRRYIFWIIKIASHKTWIDKFLTTI